MSHACHPLEPLADPVATLRPWLLERSVDPAEPRAVLDRHRVPQRAGLVQAEGQ